jgi:hypothetical protein
MAAADITLMLFGCVFLALNLFLAVLIPNPTPSTHIVFRVVLALAAAAIIASIPGMLNLQLDFAGVSMRAGGALAAFAMIYVITPRSPE